MRKKYYILFLLLFFVTAKMYSQNGKAFVIYDTIPIKEGTKKAKLYRMASQWLQEERGTKLVAKNRKQRMLLGRGYFVYYNKVKLPDVFLSPRANERTKGSIVFDITIHIQDSIIVVKHSNFVHEGYFSEYGTMSFGRLMDYEKVPPGKCMEVEEWCNATWKDMKEKATMEVEYRVKRMIPIFLVRRRTFRVREEVNTGDSLEVKDPNAHLNFEQYIIHDKKEEPKPVPQEVVNPEEKDGDEVDDDGYEMNEDDGGYGDDENVEEETVKKKKKKDEEEGIVYEVDEEKDKKAKKEKNKKEEVEEADPYGDDPYADGDEAEPKKEEKSKKEKTKKVKEKKEKTKKSKKEEEDDDYDDYDDGYDDY